MTVLSHPHLSSASSSRPISTFCASDEDEEDPWAVKGDTPAPSHAMTQDPRQPIENVGYSINDDDDRDGSNAYNGAGGGGGAAPYSPPPPAFSDEDDSGAAGMGGMARKSRGSDEMPRSTATSQQDQQHQRQHRSTPSSSFAPPSKTSSSLDPWAANNSQPSSAWGVNRSPNAATAPSNTSSAIRGGFTSSSYGNQDEDEDEQNFNRPPPAPRSPPGPSSWVAVELRPDVEGLIFKYNSYNVIRRPISNGDEADDLTASSARLLDTTRKTRLQSSSSSSRPGASAYTAPPLPSSLAYASASSANTTVVRRYSDFVWLNDILLRRYPFRLVPVLPPKRLSIPVGGRNLSDAFIEKRRRGLQRYLRAVVSHPVLSADDIVQVFLSDKQAMSEYKLSHPNISLEEESTIALPPSTALVTVPRDLSTKLDLTTTQTPTMVERWSTLCTLFERIAKRIESQGGDYARLGSLIDAISQGGGAGAGASAGVGPGRSTSPPISSSSPALSSSSSSALASSLHRDFSDLCTVRSRSLTLHALEGLKTQRDLWLSWRDLLARHVALAGDNVPSLKSQVASTRAKLAALNAVAPAQRPPTFHADVAKVEETLRTDSLQIERLLQRRERVRAAMWEELGLLAARKEEVAGVWREWCKEELLGRAAQKRAVEECWAQMSGAGGAGGAR